MQSDMLSAFEEIKSVGVGTLKMQRELELSYQQPGSPVEGTSSPLMRNQKKTTQRKDQVTQQNVLQFMGAIEEKVALLLMETGNQFSV